MHALDCFACMHVCLDASVPVCLPAMHVIRPVRCMQEFLRREELLMGELAAVRGQVDTLLSQQSVLINLVASVQGAPGE